MPRNPAQQKGQGAPLQREAQRAHALNLLLQGDSISEVATAVKVSRTTVWRWAREPEFAQVLAALRDDATEEARAQLRAATVSAVHELIALLKDPSADIRLRAVSLLLSRAGIDGKEKSNPVEDWLRDIFGDDPSEPWPAPEVTEKEND